MKTDKKIFPLCLLLAAAVSGCSGTGNESPLPDSRPQTGEGQQITEEAPISGTREEYPGTQEEQPESTLEEPWESTLEDPGTLEDLPNSIQTPEEQGYDWESLLPAPAQPAFYDDIFEGVYANPDGSGPPATFDEACEGISNPLGGGLDSYYLLETEKLLTLSECKELGGWDEFYGDRGSKWWTTEAGDEAEAMYPADYTVYRVKVLKDLISGEDCGYNMYLAVTWTYDPVHQEPGDPVFAPGELFASAISLPSEETEIRKTTGSYMFRYDVYETERGYMAFSRSRNYVDIPEGTPITGSRVTSTTGNPARYHQMIDLDTLSGYIKDRWQEKGISSHFS